MTARRNERTKARDPRGMRTNGMVFNEPEAMAYCKTDDVDNTLISQRLATIQLFRKGALYGCAVIVLMAACGAAKGESFLGQQMKLHNEIQHNGVISIVEIDRNVISSETSPSLQVTFTIKNMTSSPIPFTFSSTQQYDFLIQDDSGQQLWKWSDDKFFAMMMVEKELGQEPWVYREHIPTVNRDGNSLTKGHYVLRVQLTSKTAIENHIAFRVE
ncbi:BsuPI-related putative proteinase inhibitor [Acidobacteria bacterium AH-259-D05]|nr:BsuPI-related putative proteinase inhibitor [Acidobacteria bacterium AH-259-D05]